MTGYSSKRTILMGKEACDNCIGRQFRHSFSGYSNAEIGAAVRQASSAKEALALLEKGVTPAPPGCAYCGTTIQRIPELTSKALEIIANYDYDSFLVGARIPKELVSAEETMWEEVGAQDSETLKKELVRTIGLAIEKKTGKDVSFEAPDITILTDFIEGKASLNIHSFFIYGQYQKTARLPQTKWWCMRCRGRGCPECGFRGKLYDESVEELVGVPSLKVTGGKKEKFHGSGREDIDAKMLGWRPFVLEIEKPIRRHLDFDALTKDINSSAEGKIAVQKLRKSSREELRFLKAVRHEKTYEAIIECEKPYDKTALSKIEKALLGATIEQQTPERVMHRRADLVRKRKVITLSLSPVSDTELRAEIRTEAGTYIKELVSSDGGRTKPAFADWLGNCKIKELNVLEIHGEKELMQ